MERPPFKAAFCLFNEGSPLETPRAAHCTMVAGFASGFDAADLFFFEVVYEFGDNSFLHTKLFQAGMRE